ncbi:MAG: hypothetical protein H6R01_158 [Burkholderiaceae bacterium]|nr:hypothetical protein [Burkholderiaceae bacterium]
MKFWGKTKLLLLVAASALTACSDPVMVSLGGAPTDNAQSVARIREGSMFVRGFDQRRLELKEIRNPIGNFVFAVTPGTHSLLAMNVQSGHVIPTEAMRCYAIEAEMKAGVIYRLDEDKGMRLAVLKREDTGERVAVGALVSEQSAYSDVCRWK